MTNITSHDSEKSAQGQQVITSCAFIFHDFDGIKKLFLPKRAKTKKFLPNVFELPGGHIEFGEDTVSGLKREIQEEFEMEVIVGEPFYVFTYTNEVKGSHSIEVIYFAEFSNPINEIKIHPEDHSEYVWISEDEINLIVDQNKREDDEEIKAIRKGFKIINSK